jgi:hypothetical protein
MSFNRFQMTKAMVDQAKLAQIHFCTKGLAMQTQGGG